CGLLLLPYTTLFRSQSCLGTCAPFSSHRRGSWIGGCIWCAYCRFFVCLRRGARASASLFDYQLPTGLFYGCLGDAVGVSFHFGLSLRGCQIATVVFMVVGAASCWRNGPAGCIL